MSGTGAKPLNVKQWAILAVLGVVATAAAAAVWHFEERWLQPPEEQRWANFYSPLASPNTIYNDVKNYPSSTTKPADPDVKPTAEKWDEPNVAVYSAPATAPASAPVTLQSLSDAGQAHAIDFLGKNPGKADVAWPQLLKTLDAPDAGAAKKDPYRAERVLVATVAKGLKAMPGDRLFWTRIFVQPINFEFANYTVASTDARTTKIADIEDTVNSKLPLGFGLASALPGISKDAPAPSLDSTRKTTAEVNQQYESLGVDIKPDFLRIIRESAAGGDVMGNTAIEMSVLTDPQKIRIGADDDAHIDDSKTPSLVIDEAHLTDGVMYLDKKLAKILVHPQDVLPHCPLIANVWMLYEMRKVKDGYSNYLEGLQTVELVRGAEPMQRVEIVRADDIAPAVWSIKRKPKDQKSPWRDKSVNLSSLPDLGASLPDRSIRRVVSTDYVTLSELAHWIAANGPSATLSRMKFDNADGETLIPFKNVWNDCKKPPEGKK